ncbi:MAG TPA: STAS domain-containing protein [Dongiaceae bacterium]|nr:STAS domain-containing protein [Dongiaceae bacterium]
MTAHEDHNLAASFGTAALKMTEYTIEHNATSCRVVLGGHLTASVVPELRTCLKTELDRGADEVVFDLGKTATLDSSGLGLLVATHNSLAPKQGKLRVVSVSGDILRLLERMRLVSRLNVSGRATS